MRTDVAICYEANPLVHIKIMIHEGAEEREMEKIKDLSLRDAYSQHKEET